MPPPPSPPLESFFLAEAFITNIDMHMHHPSHNTNKLNNFTRIGNYICICTKPPLLTFATPIASPSLSLTTGDGEGKVEGYWHEVLSTTSLALCIKSARSIRPVYMCTAKKGKEE